MSLLQTDVQVTVQPIQTLQHPIQGMVEERFIISQADQVCMLQMVNFNRCSDEHQATAETDWPFSLIDCMIALKSSRAWAMRALHSLIRAL